jgi:RNA polymerase sigma-70 factor (TIGR02960 family)
VVVVDGHRRLGERTGPRWTWHDDRVTQAVPDRARAGDPDAFRQLTDPFRRELLVHCYRILGSVADAEDVLQETLVAAWRGLDGFEGRSSPRTWLYRIATNRCLNAVRAASRRRPPEPVPPFDPPEPTRRAAVTWLQPCPDQVEDEAPGPEARYGARESVELAFIAGLQLLPPRQAATLVLRDVLGYSTAEAADLLGTTPTAVKAALQRARARLDGADPERVPPPGSPRERDLARRFAAAYVADDVDGVLALLTDDAWLAMPPAPHEYQGPEAIGAFLAASAASRGDRRFRLVPTRANGQPAFGCYLTGVGPVGLLVLTLRDDRISAITRFLDADLPRRFGLPEALDG